MWYSLLADDTLAGTLILAKAELTEILCYTDYFLSHCISGSAQSVQPEAAEGKQFLPFSQSVHLILCLLRKRKLFPDLSFPF